MHPIDIAKDTAKIVQNYLTYKAVMLVIEQLAETNPSEAIWLRQYSSGGKLRDAEAYLEDIMSNPRGKELAMRIMTVRKNIAEQTLEFLPEMVTSNIEKDNLVHRRSLLERLTRSQSDESSQSSSDISS
ncbi:MAG: chaperonin family protein RbcX [Cyanobacteria bacterium P01_G01_bin.19]